MISHEKNVEAVRKYRKENKIKRVEIAFYPQDFERLKAAADAAGESVAGYIKQAISGRMEKVGKDDG